MAMKEHGVRDEGSIKAILTEVDTDNVSWSNTSNMKHQTSFFFFSETL